MSYRYHGQYCGPGWSGGKYQSSVDSSVPADDPFDQTCKEHDAAYANGLNNYTSDFKFAVQNLGFDLKRSVAGGLVGIQGVARYVGILENGSGRDKLELQTPKPTQLSNTNYISEMAKNKSRRGNKILEGIKQRGSALHAAPMKESPIAVANRQRSRLARAFPDVRVSPAPVSIGNTITASTPVMRMTGDGLVVAGREFMTSVSCYNSSNFQVGALAPLHPMYYPGSVMSSTARAWSQYRFNRVAIHYVTRQSTAQAGEVVLAYSENLLEPAEQGNANSFLPRVMTRGQAIIGPVWQNHTMLVNTDNKFRKVDAFNSATFNDNVTGEIQAYTQSLVTDTLGFLLIDYELEFKTPMFTPHSSALPWADGPGSLASASGTLATTSGGGVILPPFGVNPITNGTIFRCIIDADRSVVTPYNLNTVFSTGLEYPNAAGVETTVLTVCPVKDGSVLFAVVVNSQLVFYTSVEAAIGGSGSGCLLWSATNVSTTYSINFYVYPIRVAPTEAITAD